MSNPLPQLPIGHVIGERYRIQSLIGRGGMGLVYSATHQLTGRKVALKLVVPDSEDSPILKERFLSEARIAATVVHPNIVDVLDMGVHDGMLFLVMELLEGISLERMLEAQSRLTPDQTFGWMFPILGALATLHDAGIVHRDVKPSNIFLSSLPRHPVRPKLLDFGLARVVSDLRLTRSGSVIGTPLYMAPEHAAGQVVGPQADVWSMGVLLFECLAGTSPFVYSDRSSLAAQVLAGVTRPLSDVRPDLPVVLSSVIGRALQRDLGRRYQDMRAFAYALYAAGATSGIPLPRDPDPIGLPDYDRWASETGGAAVTAESKSGPSSARFVPEVSGSSPSALFAPLDSASSMLLETGRSRRRAVAIGALFLLLLGAIAYGVWSNSEGGGEVPAPLGEGEPAPGPTVEPMIEPPAAQTKLPGEPPAAPPNGKSDNPSPSPGKAAMPPAARREPGSSRRRPPAEHSKPVKVPSGEEKTRSESVDEVESEWK